MTNAIRRLSESYPAPTLDDGHPVDWAPTSSTSEEWGTFKVYADSTWGFASSPPVMDVEGTDITTIRGARTLIDSLNFAEPFGETTGQLTFPTLTEYDAHSGALAWLHAGANIDVYQVLPSTTEVPYWCGFIASVNVSSGHGIVTGVTVQLSGALTGEAALRAHQPQMLDDDRDIGTCLAHALDPAAYSRPLAPYRFEYETATTGIETRTRGSRGTQVIDACDELLALAQDSTGQWTIARAYSVGDTYQARKYYLRQKSDTFAGAIQTSTVWAGARGIALSLVEDYTERPNAIYGEGTDTDGSRWRNAKYPMLTPSAPAYPDRIVGTTYPLQTGDTDDLFTADVITQLQYELRAGGWPEVQINGTFDQATVVALEALQEDAGVTVTGTIADNAGWDLVWSTGTGTTDLSSGYFRPLSVVSEAEPYTYAANGAVTGDNASYDGRIRVDRVVSFGDRISLARARIYARRVATQSLNPVWNGTMTLTADPVEHSRLDIREGGWIKVKSLMGSDMTFYVAGVSVSPETDGLPVQLTISTQPYDLLDLTTRLERDREARENPAKSFYSQRTRPQRPFRDVVGWDKESGAGIIRPTSLVAGWNVIKIVGAQYGTIAGVNVHTRNPARAFALALFGKQIDAAGIAALVASPLIEEPDGYGWWNLPAIQQDLADAYFIEAWGEYNADAGYSPGQKVSLTDVAHPVTGYLTDAASWTFVSDDPPFIWVGIWVEDACTFRGSMRIQVEE